MTLDFAHRDAIARPPAEVRSEVPDAGVLEDLNPAS